MKNLIDLSGKRILITGGGTGIGFAIAKTAAGCGASVAVSGRRQDVLDAAIKELGASAKAYSHDVSDLSKAAAFVAEVEADGPLWGLVNCAGQNIKKPFYDTTDEIFADILSTNIIGLFSLTREVGKKMLEREEGSIVNIVSMANIFGLTNTPAYTASKSALAGLTRELAVEMGPHGITVNSVAPGFIETAMTKKAFDGDPQRKAKVLGRTPLGKMGQPSDVAAAAAFFLSPAARYINGVMLPVDGGTSIGF